MKEQYERYKKRGSQCFEIRATCTGIFNEAKITAGSIFCLKLRAACKKQEI
jgi:hypothetical protein